MSKKVAVLSIDLDMRNTTNSPMDEHPIAYASVVTNEEILFVVTEAFHVDNKNMREFYRLFDGYVATMGLDTDPCVKMEIRVARTGLDAVRQVFQYMSDAKVDIVSVWNLHFEGSIIESKANYVGYDLGKLLCDRNDDDENKSAKYTAGFVSRMSPKGIVPLAMQERNAFLDVKGRFKVYNSLYYYAALRPEEKQQTYTLRNIMKVEMGFKNPVHEMMPDLKGKEWFVALQKTHPTYAYLEHITQSLALLAFENEKKDLSEKAEPFDAEVKRRREEYMKSLAEN